MCQPFFGLLYKLIVFEFRNLLMDTSARVAPISDSVIGGMLASKCAITQANRTYILKDSLFAFSRHRKLNLIWQQGVGC